MKRIRVLNLCGVSFPSKLNGRFKGPEDQKEDRCMRENSKREKGARLGRKFNFMMNT